jgi:hypothetical protein
MELDMARIHPYQPVLLRGLHGVASGLLVLALISGFLVYNTYDKRWGSIAFPAIGDIQGVHGTIALTFLLVLPAFALYSFRIGHHRLVQEQSLSQLKQVGQPVWWIAAHRIANTLMLLAATVAVVTGRMMKEEWLPAGEVNRVWYIAHLIAWGGVLMSLALHVLMGAKVGGVPLLLSMFNWKIRSADKPLAEIQTANVKRSSLLLKVIEGMVIGAIIMAFLLPAFNT